MAGNHPILVVEDDVNDVFFLKYAFDKAEIKNPVMVVGNGQQAIDYLSGRRDYSDRKRFPLPGLILLDLNLPIMPGMDVVKWKHEQPKLSAIPLVILTSSRNEEEVEECYQRGIEAYLVKPLSNAERVEVAKTIKSCWIDPEPVAIGGEKANVPPYRFVISRPEI